MSDSRYPSYELSEVGIGSTYRRSVYCYCGDDTRFDCVLLMTMYTDKFNSSELCFSKFHDKPLEYRVDDRSDSSHYEWSDQNVTIAQWVDKHIQGKWNFVAEYLGPDRNYNYVWSFNNPQDAMLFKLTWC